LRTGMPRDVGLESVSVPLARNGTPLALS
jgi:hypothetical protein